MASNVLRATPSWFQATPLEPFPRERDISPDEIALLHMRTLTWTYPAWMSQERRGAMLQTRCQ